MSHEKIIDFISALRDTDPYIETIYMQGGCYRFHLLLKKLVAPDAVPMLNLASDHVVSYIGRRFYDISGEVEPSVFGGMSEDEIEEVESWSFSRNKILQIGECPVCDEPIVS